MALSTSDFAGDGNPSSNRHGKAPADERSAGHNRPCHRESRRLFANLRSANVIKHPRRYALIANDSAFVSNPFGRD